MSKDITISEHEYLALLMFRDDMAWYWIRYRSANEGRFDYDGFMTYHQIDSAPQAKYARLAYWWQLKKDSE